jgi:tetratricopeptide (TPR) repeat protein
LVVAAGDELLEYIQARINEAIATKSPAPLEGATLVAAGRLKALLSQRDDIEGEYCLGLLFWFRVQELPTGYADAEADLETAIDMLSVCFQSGIEDEALPTALLPLLAERSVRAAGEFAERATYSGDPGLLAAAIGLVGRVLAHALSDHPDRGWLIGNRCMALQALLEQSSADGEGPDPSLPSMTAELDSAIDLWREVTRQYPADDSNRRWHLGNLAMVLYRRYERAVDPADLEAAIAMWRETAAAFPAGDPDVVVSFNNLSLALFTRSQMTGTAADLDEAVSCAREAVAASAAHPMRNETLISLAIALGGLFDRTGAVADLDEAIELRREAAWARLSEDPGRANEFGLLATALDRRFRLTGAVADLDEAIDVSREAVAFVAPGADWVALVNNLGKMLHRRFVRTGSLTDLDEAISLGRAVVRTVDADSPERAKVLGNLAEALESLFERTGAVADLDAFISVGRETVAAAAPQDPARANWVNDLANALRVRSERTGAMADLDEAIQLGAEAVHGALADDPDQPRHLADLGNSLRLRAEWTGSMTDLDEALRWMRAAELVAAESSSLPAILANLGFVLRMRFELTGLMPELNEAIELGREAVRTTSPSTDPASRALRLMHLATSLRVRFERTGALAELDEAISLGQEALSLASAEHAHRAQILDVLSAALRIRFVRTGALGDLDASVEVGRQAVAAPADVGRAGRLSNLGVALRYRYLRTGGLADLDAAITAGQDAVSSMPDDKASRAVALNNLGTALRHRFEATGSLTDLDAAIRAGEQAVETSRRPDRPGYLNNLANALRVRYQRSQNPQDLDAAIDLGQEVVAAIPPDHPVMAGTLSNLGLNLRFRAEQAGATTDLDAAVAAFVAAAGLGSAQPSVRIRAGRAAGELLAGDDPHRAARLLEGAVRLLPEVALRRLGRGDRQETISEFAGLAADAAALALSDPETPAAERPGRALRLLESGRAVLLSQALESRSDTTDLRERHPDLAARFVELRDLLDQPAPTPDGPPVDLRALAEELAALLDRIRALEGFESFALPPAEAELVTQAAAGPVVTFNVSAYRSDALLLTRDGITALELPGLVPETLADQIHAFHRARAATTDPDADRVAAEAELREILAWLWDVAAGPVLDALALTEPPVPDEAPPRVWWAPGGLLGMLPLHAAGHHIGTPDSPPRTVIDRVVSSYTPTIGALRHARRHASGPGGPDRTLIVAMPTTPGLPNEGRLPHVAREAALLQTRLPRPVMLVEPASGTSDTNPSIPTRAAVFTHLADCGIAHFACHGSSDPTDPSLSMLLLHDHQADPLTVASLAPVDLATARLAYLSACDTAVTADTPLRDEAIHLASAFQLAGFPHVIGTLWSINDRLAADVAAAFYTRLNTGGSSLDTGQAAHALHHSLHAVIADLRRTPSLWAAFLHSGA